MLNRKQRQAVRLLADGLTTSAGLARRLRVTAQTVAKWKKSEEFQLALAKCIERRAARAARTVLAPVPAQPASDASRQQADGTTFEAPVEAGPKPDPSLPTVTGPETPSPTVEPNPQTAPPAADKRPRTPPAVPEAPRRRPVTDLSRLTDDCRRLSLCELNRRIRQDDLGTVSIRDLLAVVDRMDKLAPADPVPSHQPPVDPLLEVLDDDVRKRIYRLLVEVLQTAATDPSDR